MSFYEDCLQRFPDLLKVLESANERHRLAHAYLVTSPVRRTREAFARALAMLGVCPDPVRGRPCGVCHFCRGMAQGVAEEVRTLGPVGKMYQIQVGDRINPEANTLRYFQEQFQMTDISGAARKAGIIFEADRMNPEAQNALLKTLEEPPGASLLILCTGNPASLLPTTRSRCQELFLAENACTFEFAGADETAEVLKRLFFQCPGDTGKTVAAADDLCRIAASLQEDARNRTGQDWEARIADAAAMDESLARRMGKLQEDAASGAYRQEREAFLTLIHTFCAQLMMLSSGVPAEELPNPELLRDVDAAQLPSLQDRALRALNAAEALQRNLHFMVNEELALHSFAFEVAGGAV